MKFESRNNSLPSQNLYNEFSKHLKFIETNNHFQGKKFYINDESDSKGSLPFYLVDTDTEMPSFYW